MRIKAAAQTMAEDLVSGVERSCQRMVVTDADGAELL